MPHADLRLGCRLTEELDGIRTLAGGLYAPSQGVAPRRFARASKASPPVIKNRIAIMNSRSYPRPIRCSPSPHWLPKSAWGRRHGPVDLERTHQTAEQMRSNEHARQAVALPQRCWLLAPAAFAYHVTRGASRRAPPLCQSQSPRRRLFGSRLRRQALKDGVSGVAPIPTATQATPFQGHCPFRLPC